MSPTDTRRIEQAREHITHIRCELDQLESTLARAGGFRGGAFLNSLQDAFNSASSANVHAFQLQLPRYDL